MTDQRQERIAKIARDILGLETLEARNHDALDFHELGVWQIKKALDAAYQAGRQDAARPQFTGAEVPEGCECPNCGECHADALVWDEVCETVRCAACGTQYRPNTNYEM